jgi:hypothetical protein
LSQFNDPTSEVCLLLITTALGAVSLNLQAGAACIIVMEIPLSFYMLLQVIGRVNRIGQGKIQRVYLLWTNLSFDQICLHRILKKIVPSLAGESHSMPGEAPEVTAQRRVQQLLGMKPSHLPYHKAWATAPYDAKDKIPEPSKENMSDSEDEDDNGEGDTTGRRRWHRYRRAFPVQNRPTRKLSTEP